jgi:ATP-dependent DNA ligase
MGERHRALKADQLHTRGVHRRARISITRAAGVTAIDILALDGDDLRHLPLSMRKAHRGVL